jgi:hypothetical protein
MDPDKALASLREAVIDAKYRDEAALAADPGLRLRRTHNIDYEPMREFIENFEALDAWLTKGGFLPADWKKGR